MFTNCIPRISNGKKIMINLNYLILKCHGTCMKFKVLIEIQTIRSIAVRKSSDSDRIRSCFPLQNAGKCQDFYKLHFVFESHTNTVIFFCEK